MRKRVGIILDYSIRVPDFHTAYNNLKNSIISNEEIGHSSDEDTGMVAGYWQTLKLKEPESFEFYVKTVPPAITDPTFDISYKSYFHTPEQRAQFLLEYSFNLYGSGSPLNKEDIKNLNLAQTHLFDIVLIDRCTNSRKISNTFAYLSRAGLFIKEIVFVNTDEEIKEIEKDLLGIWNPFDKREQAIVTEGLTATQALLDWLMSLEKLTKE